MKVSFRQGIVSYETNALGQAQFLALSQTSGYIDFDVSGSPCVVTFAHGTSNYLQVFNTDALAAWGPLQAGNNFLYWDIDLFNAQVSYGLTTIEPFVGTEPPNPVDPTPTSVQHWFNPSTATMKIWTGVTWRTVVRAFAGRVNGISIFHEPQNTSWRAVLPVQANTGYIATDIFNNPIRTVGGEFVTSETPIRFKSTVGTTGVLAVLPNAYIPVRAGENIPAMSLVCFSGEDVVSLASGNPAINPPRIPIGVVCDSLNVNEVGVLTQSGEITYDQWDWADHIGKPVYCGDSGEIVKFRPNGLMVYRVGFVKNSNTIIFQVDAETVPQVYQADLNEVVVNGVTPVRSEFSVNSLGERVWSVSVSNVTGAADGLMTAEQALLLNSLSNRVTEIEADVPDFAPASHVHAILDVTDLQTSLDGKMQLVPGAVVGNLARFIDGGQVEDANISVTAFSQIGHLHALSDVTGLQEILDTKVDTAQLDGLLAAFMQSSFRPGENITFTPGVGSNEGKTLINANLPFTALTDVAVPFPLAIGDIVNWNGTAWTATNIEVLSELLTGFGRPAGPKFAVQIADDGGRFAFIPNGSAGRVLTSNGNATPTWEIPEVSGGTVTSVEITGGTTGLRFTGTNPIETSGELELDGVLAIRAGGTGGIDETEAIRNLLRPQLGQPGAALITDGASTSWQVLPGSAYTAGIGIGLNGTIINSLVTPDDGALNRVSVTNGDGTLSYVPAGPQGYVLTSAGPGSRPVWDNAFGTVSQIIISKPQTMGLYITGGDEFTPVPNPLAKQITQTGNISLAGTLTILHGGTGQSTARDAINALLPSQPQGTPEAPWHYLGTNGDGDVRWSLPYPPPSLGVNDGLYLRNNGSSVYWDTGINVGIDNSVITSSFLNTVAFAGETGLTGQFNDSVIDVAGVLAVAHGGTGGETPAEAINNILPNQAGKQNYVLTSDGTDVQWTTVGVGTVQSIDVVALDELGLVFTGGPVVDNGVITLGGVLAVEHGGTGATDRDGIIQLLLPLNPSLVGKVLSNNGEDLIWTNTGTVSSVAGGSSGLAFTPPSPEGNVTISGGFLSPAFGGTGVESLAELGAELIPIMLPDQEGQAGRILVTNGTDLLWALGGTGSVTSIAIDGSTTGLSFAGGPISTAGTFVLGGVLGLANGGTGQTSAESAINALLPIQGDANINRVLSTNGDDVFWREISAVGTVTSVALSGGTSGMTFVGGPITTDGTIELEGILAIKNGGTGAETRGEALTNILPLQTGNNGRVLGTNGTTASWVQPSSTAAGQTTQVQFNTSGVLAGSPSMTFASGTGTLTVTSLNTAGVVDMSGQVFTTVFTLPTATINCSTGTFFARSLTGPNNWVFNNPPPAGKAYIFALRITNGAAGVQQWPTSVRWPGGTAPSLTANTDVLIFTTVDGGVTWNGSSILNYAS